MSEKTEVAYLIERAGLCLGFCEQNFKWVTFTDESALRLSRRSDAVRLVETMRVGYGLNLENVQINEHMWN